jgi:uncharacterized protein (TIGR02301 family)
MRTMAGAFLGLALLAAYGAEAQNQSPPAQQQRAPAQPDDKPYDTQLLRLAELMGSLHYLRELCGANEGQNWRGIMQEIVAAEGTNALRRARFVESFNRGYRGYSRTYRSCTPTALTAIQRFVEQANTIAAALAGTDR